MTSNRQRGKRIVDELLVAEIWERQAFDPDSLRRLGLNVVFRGTPSDAGGPDYQDAMFINGESNLLTGDVEFHVHTSDWSRHGHHVNPKYNQVVLHVVWVKDDESTIREDGQSIPVLQLSECALPLPHVESRGGQLILEPHPCISAFGKLSLTDVAKAVKEVAIQGLLERAERYDAEASVIGPSQTLYAAILESMGYASNRTAFAGLAQAVPYHWLMTISPQHRSELLLYVAGLTDISPVRCTVRLPPASWRLERLRPANHPYLRIQGTVALMDRFPPLIADSAVDAVARAINSSSLRKELEVRLQGACFIGSGRANEILVSVLLPFVSAMEPESSKPQRLLETGQSPPANKWTRFMTSLLALAGHEFKVRTAIEHQGLHHLYHRHCRYSRRDGCPVCSHAS
ncbi:MAG: hypothetical protein NVSMB52_16400 [Chloroflexota bacterium]